MRGPESNSAPREPKFTRGAPCRRACLMLVRLACRFHLIFDENPGAGAGCLRREVLSQVDDEADESRSALSTRADVCRGRF